MAYSPYQQSFEEILQKKIHRNQRKIAWLQNEMAFLKRVDAMNKEGNPPLKATQIDFLAG